MRIARRFLVSGRVQGVGFRYFVQAAASREHLHGWVRNLPGGHVEALAEGAPEAIARFEQQLRQGPASARVDRVDAVDQVPSIGEAGFTIR
jgi:acylphosphatase